MKEEGKEIEDSMDDLKLESKEEAMSLPNIDAEKPLHVMYCPICTLPPEYCEYNVPEVFEKCLPWILANCKHVLSKAVLAKYLGEEIKDDEKEDVQRISSILSYCHLICFL